MGPEPRPNLLFDTDEWPLVATRDRKPFKFYLRQTPATPLSAAIKVMLGVTAFVVAALLVVVLVRGARGAGTRPSPRSLTEVHGLDDSLGVRLPAGCTI